MFEKAKTTSLERAETYFKTTGEASKANTIYTISVRNMGS